jgi:hypothetical protein
MSKVSIRGTMSSDARYRPRIGCTYVPARATKQAPDVLGRQRIDPDVGNVWNRNRRALH